MYGAESLSSRERLLIWCGIVAPAIALGAVTLATIVAPSEEFTWMSKALSDLGRREASTFWLFNGGLIGGGLVGIVFTWPLWQRAQNRVERLGALSFSITVVGLALVGVFYLPHELHAPVALLFFAGGPVTQWLYGAGRLLADDARMGYLSIGLGIGHVLGWGGWFLYIAFTGSTDWFAVPEMVAAVVFGGWLVLVARQHLDRAENSS